MMELPDGHTRDHNLEPSRPYLRPGEYLNHPAKGIIISLYPSDDPNHGRGQILCDVFCYDLERTLFQVMLFASHFHQDTDPNEQTLAKSPRQALPPRDRNIFDGESWIPQVGTIVVIQWLGAPPNAQPFISHFIPCNYQSLPDPTIEQPQTLFPKQAQAVTIFKDGALKEEFRSRLHPTEGETPRWTRVQNGAAIEIDNRGDINLQSSLNKDPIQKERYTLYHYDQRREVDPTPAPEGNIVLSTRGAQKGNIAITTGRIKTEKNERKFRVPDPDSDNAENGGSGERQINIIAKAELEEASAEGNVLVQTSYAKQGNETHELRDAGQGSFSVFTGKNEGETKPTGDITLKTTDASNGNILFKTKSDKGNITGDTQKSLEGNIKFISSEAEEGDIELDSSKAKKGSISLKTDEATIGDILIRTKKAKSGKITITTEESTDGKILIKDRKNSSILFDTTTGDIIITAERNIYLKVKGTINFEKVT